MSQDISIVLVRLLEENHETTERFPSTVILHGKKPPATNEPKDNASGIHHEEKQVDVKKWGVDVKWMSKQKKPRVREQTLRK